MFPLILFAKIKKKRNGHVFDCFIQNLISFNWRFLFLKWKIKESHFLGHSSLADFEHQLSLSNFLLKSLSPLLPHMWICKWGKMDQDVEPTLVLSPSSPDHSPKVYSVWLPSHAFKYVCLFLTQLVILSRRIHAGESLIASSRNLNFLFVINNVSHFSHLHNLLLMVYIN